MNLMSSILVAACVAGVAGCSSVPSQVNHGPVRAGTYSLMPSKAPASVVVNERRQEIHRQIQDAIGAQLAQRGLRGVPTGGEVQVGYMVIVADNATTATYDEYFGYGRDAEAVAEKAHKAVSKRSDRNLFEIGAIVIDVVDSRDSKLLFRSYARLDVRDVNPENRAEKVNTLVASCLGNLRAGN
ncbi:MAG: DUF4136 domain-containing protein [Verrucomicrobia bacterium]|jgi:hypothetical protein|nr:DUF4136 domain-containing protein [Verrucomicrobiota bacterium]